VQWRADVRYITNSPIRQQIEKILKCWTTTSLSSRALIYGVSYVPSTFRRL